MNVRRLNDSSLEHLIAAARYSSLATGLLVAPALLAAVMSPSPWMERFLEAACVLVAWTMAAGYVGWWYLGNAAWREGRDALPSIVLRPNRQD